MTAALKLQFHSVEEYLAGELRSPTKHEYLDGTAYAMAGARVAHNLIATNTVIAVGVRLRGRPCKAFSSDMKVRIRVARRTLFYYPDLSIICRSNLPTESYQDEPVAVFEVLSASTRRIDEYEKKEAYLTVPSLAVYALIEQDAPSVTAYRRTPAGFVREAYEGLGATLPLGEMGIELPLAEVYEAVTFAAESEEGDGE